MKVKHWSGYGTVEAESLGSTLEYVMIKVVGDHEQGLEPRYFDNADWERWLGKRFHVGEISRVHVSTEWKDGKESMFVIFKRPLYGRR